MTSGEMPATLVQAGQAEWLDREAWDEAPKHPLTPNECTAFLDLLPKLEGDFDRTVLGMRFQDEQHEGA